MVLALPAFFSAASAAYFAKGAVDILNGAGIIDAVCFGAENADIEALRETADILTENERQISEAVKRGVKAGLSYPRARAAATANFGVRENLLSEPNNILAVEYIKALKTSRSKIKPFCVKRKAARHDESGINGAFASGKALREKILSNETEKIKNAVPENVFSLYKNARAHKADNLSALFQYKLKTSSEEALREVFGLDEGLENRMLKCAARDFLISGALGNVKTKRYTRAKLQRAALNTALGVTKSDFARFLRLSPGYIRVLGFKKSAQALLGALCEKSAAPVIINVKTAKSKLNAEIYDLFEKEIIFSDIYYLTNGMARQNKNDYHERVTVV